jgi:hypothetical protein
MDLANKTYKDNKTGELVKVIGSFENIAILENKQKVDVTKLTDTNFYTEQIDPGSFFSNQGSYNILADKIKNISTDNIRDDDSGEISVSVGGDGFKPAMNESAIVMTSEEDEKAELARKYGVNTKDTNSISRQNEAFAKLLGEDNELPVQQTEQVKKVEVRREEPIQQTQQRQVVLEDPIITMFKNVKRVKEFSISFEIKNKIPRPDFIEMMEDSYNTSIIDFLASEFTDNLLKNPQIIEDMIKQKIKELVYGAEIGIKDVNPQITDAVTQIGQLKNDVSFNEETGEVKVEKPKTTRKPRPNTAKGEKPGYTKTTKVKKEVSKQ